MELDKDFSLKTYISGFSDKNKFFLTESLDKFYNFSTNSDSQVQLWESFTTRFCRNDLTEKNEQDAITAYKKIYSTRNCDDGPPVIWRYNRDKYRELNIEEFYSNDGDIIGVTTAVL